MKKYLCTITYDGTNFSGFQIQPHQRTIQGEIEQALKKMHKGKDVRIHSSGRTDTGVHALGQTFHFESSLQIPTKNWTRALNAILPEDVYVKRVDEVPPPFHARFDVKEKEYRYFVRTDAEVNVFQRNYIYHYPKALDLSLMKRACRYFEGVHDFTTFSSAKATAKGSRVRTLSKVDCLKEDDVYQFILRGDGFLYHMVRIIVGVLLDVGTGEIAPEAIPHLFKAKDRRRVGDTIPPQGLYLWKVNY